MELRTRLNGGKSSLKDVAKAWQKEEHHFHWSEYETDAWAIEFAKKLEETRRREGPPKPDPRNIHDH